METEGELARDKADLRARIRAARGRIPPAEREAQTAAVEAAVLALSEVTEARTVMLFWSFGSEVSTAGIAAGLSEGGRRLLLPYLLGGEMEASVITPGVPLVGSGYGPLEPPHPAPVDPHVIDTVIVPGLAFDRGGFRVGLGGGYYDRYLSRLRANAHRVAIGFSLQLVDAVPHGPGDERMDVIVTDSGTIHCLPARSPRGVGLSAEP